MRRNEPLIAFNRGIVSPLALARVDLDRIELSAEEQTNWMPRALGSMMLRPGTEYIGETVFSQPAKLIPFIFSADDTAIIEMNAAAMTVHVDDERIVREAVTASVTNGEFTTGITGWTVLDDINCLSYWYAGQLTLTGSGFGSARVRQTVTVTELGTEHGLRITVNRGPVTFKVGSASGLDDYVAETTLREGVHSIAFTPTSNFVIDISSSDKWLKAVDSVLIELPGTLSFATPYTMDDLALIRHAQSGDVIFLACDGRRQMRIERRGPTSWSLVFYETEDGPFLLQNFSSTTIASSTLDGDATLTASSPVFKSTDVGRLITMNSAGQRVESTLTGPDQWSDYIRVSGVGASREFSVTVGGTAGNGVTLQRSFGEPGAWVTSYYPMLYGTNPTTDGLDNQIVYYRVGFSSTGYVSGTIPVSMDYTGGGKTAVARIAGVGSATAAVASVISPFGNTQPTTDWTMGAWSDTSGYPSSVALYEGRLWWAGKDTTWGSVSDAFESFDDTIEGDSRPINKSIGSGAVDRINWLVPSQRLLMGCDLAVKSIRSNGFDEVVTQSNYNIKDASTQGSTHVAAIKVDSNVVFVQQSGLRLYEMAMDGKVQDYSGVDLTVLAPKVCSSGIKVLGVQRQPDTRIHCVLNDGRVAILIYDPAESLNCWVHFETNGAVEDVMVLPGDIEDQVYYIINRTINGSTKRYIERMDHESTAQGGPANLCSDSRVGYFGAPTNTLSGLLHLEGEEVEVWADSRYVGTRVVDSGSITIDVASSLISAGLGYEARYKSSKLAYAAQMGTALTQRKRVNSVGVILADTHAKGLEYGPDFTIMDSLPATELSAIVDGDTVHSAYDHDAIEFPGSWDTDSRLCLRARAPLPCTVLAAVIGMATHDKA